MIAMTTPCAESRTASAVDPAGRKKLGSATECQGYANYPTPLLTAEEERVLAARIKGGDREARNALIVANLRLVVHLAKRYHCNGATIDDLIQEGTRGLIRATRDYDPEVHNTRFSSYATYWIRNSIQRAIAANSSLIRLPDYIFLRRSQYRRGRTQARSEEQLTGDSGIKLSKRQYRCLLHSMIEQTPYVMIGTEGEVTSLEEAIADSYRPERELEREETLKHLHEALNRLTPLEAWVIRRRFGIADPSGSPETTEPTNKARTRRGRLSFRDVSRVFGISPLHVRKIEENALEKLQRYLEPRVAPDGVLDD